MKFNNGIYGVPASNPNSRVKGLSVPTGGIAESVPAVAGTRYNVDATAKIVDTTLSTNGGPVLLNLQPVGAISGGATLGIENTAGGSVSLILITFDYYRDETPIASYTQTYNLGSGFNNGEYLLHTLSITFIDNPPPGNYNYSLRAVNGTTGVSLLLGNMSLVAVEL